MANSGGGVGAKFVSVNLNKSYGQPSHSNNPFHGGSYGQAAAVGRGRGGSGGGGGGMVVLSRSRSSQKPGPKLSVPPPLNLPSLRKEHERFDVSGSGSGTGGPGAGAGPRPTSSGMGWTKPVSIGSQEKNGSAADAQVEQSVDNESRVGVAYMPPSARSSGTGAGASAAGSARAFPPPVEKAVVLRGEDFPSLKAALPVSSGPGMKQKDNLNQKQKQVLADELTDQHRDGYHFNSVVDMRPQSQSSRQIPGNGTVENRSESPGLGNSHIVNPSRKEYFPGPLPLVRLNPRSDWADDERDTGHGFADRSRDFGNSKLEDYWDRDFDMPRASILPHKPVYNQHERRGLRDDETGRGISSDVFKLDPYRGDIRTPSREGREGNAWRSSSLHRDGLNAQEVANDRNNLGARETGLNKDFTKENRYVPPHAGDSSQAVGVSGNQETNYGRRNTGPGHYQEGRPQWNHMKETYNNRGNERIARDRYSSDQSSRYRVDTFQNAIMPRSSFSASGKVATGLDSVLTTGREKLALSRNERSYLEDPFIDSAGYDERDPFTGSLVGVIKRKKENVKQTDFHDPVRESFEAELERVQKIQELERQRIIEEQERALKQARKEEEERQRLIREEEDRRRRLEEEAREAAWRAEQERLEAIRKAEEQKIAREEEKRRMVMEEERRKQAAYQKLLELEAKIAKRGGNTDGSVSTRKMEDKFSVVGKDKDISSSPTELDTWEDSERMVERITSSTSVDSPALNRPFDMSSRHYPAREGSSSSLDKGKPFNSWRRDVYDNGNIASSQPLVQEINHFSPRRDSFANGRTAPRKEFYAGAGYTSSRAPGRGTVPEPYADEFGHQKEQRWNFPGEADPYNRNRDMDSEFQDNPSEKYGDVGWGQNRYRGNARPPFPERQYPNSEADELYSYGRSRYSMRQPRVFPPPLITSTQRIPFRGGNERPGPSGYLDNDENYSHEGRSENTMSTGYIADHQDSIEQSGLVNMQRENTADEDQKMSKDMTPRCDSQSSVSVSSPPNSPPHLSHDELDESGDSPMISTTAEGNQISPSGTEAILNDNTGQHRVMTASSSISAVEDDEWALQNNNELQEQEEYDEDEDGYQEEDEVREGDAENVDLNQEFEDLHLEDKSSSHIIDNLVLGFDEGVEVEIPSDDFERNLSNEEDRGFGIPDSSGHIVGEEAPVGVQRDEQSHEQIDGASQETVVQESEKTMQNSVAQPVSDSYISIMPENTALSFQQTMSTSDMGLSSGHNPISTVSSATSQVDVPVKLQFGLFSGPSLIPSPVPAIQIGSIQMPLHLHPPIGSSLAHIHPQQPPIFQFGQLRYTSPISQGVMPIPPHSMSFVQPSAQPHYSLNQNAGGSLPAKSTRNSSTQSGMKDDMLSSTVNKQQPGYVLGPGDQSHGNPSSGFSSVVIRETTDNSGHTQNTSTAVSGSGNDKKLIPESVAQAEVVGKNDPVVKNSSSSSRGRLSESQMQPQQSTGESFSCEKTSTGMKPHGPFSGSKGKRFAYAVKNSGMRSSFPASDFSGSDTNGFQRRSRRTVQRTEFRVRENAERRQQSGSVSSNTLNLDNKSNNNGKYTGNFARSGSKRGTMSSKPMKQSASPESSVPGNSSSQEIDSANHVRKEVSLSQNVSGSGEGNLKRNISEEDVDAPLQSGVVRVFKQPGIEAPSDEDDFIEVRSKRQMLNDRREQREKEIRAKSRATKPPRKPRAMKPTTSGLTNSRKTSASVSGESLQNHGSDFASSEGRSMAYKETPAGLISQPLPPIGTPAVKSDVQTDKRSQIKPLQSSSLSIVSGGTKELGPTVNFENKNKVLDNVPTSLSSWDTARINHQVMSLTQTQLEEAMKPPRYDAPIASVGGHSSTTSEPLLPSSSILSKERSFPSAASPINSLLAGEKIQFGAVTSPTVLPPSNRAPGSSRAEIQISHKLSADEDDCTLFFEKDKKTDNSCVHLQDSEAEAEAAASAIAVAAISTDEVIVNGLGSVSIPDSKSFAGADVDGIATGMTGDQQLANQSRADESLSVSLPADLSVETPPISLWPPLPSPQSSSSQMLSHFPGGPPSHFPFYEMNPMLGGPIFAFGPHEEATGSQSQPQKSTSTSSSGSLASWQQCHSTVDSFYGPPAGFTGPFMNPPGGIPGVQGPPHMVVYNHFAPVGQFGQVGLSFMGPTYIPSGKPPDWKHNAQASAVGMGDGDLNNANIAPAQRNAPNMPSPMQHLAQGSPLMPVASPLTMFDVSPFQSSPDMSVQARWPHVPASPLHAVSLSRPHQQQVEGVIPSQFGHTHSIDQSINLNRFSEVRSSTPSENGASFAVATEANARQFPNELGLVDSSRSISAGLPSQTAVSESSSTSVPADVGKTDHLRSIGSNNNEGHNSSGFKARSNQQKNLSAHQNHPSNYNYQRGGGGAASHRSSSTGNEWSHRRMGFHGRNQSFGAEKGFPSSKMKQVYVAKQTSATSTGD